MESTESSFASSSQLQLPAGFRFHPTDEELVIHYLKRKADSVPLPVSIIADIDLYKYDPWELPNKATFGEQEWYFFTPRDRKYPNGARPNRAATSGYWKATGTDKPILASNGTNNKIGVKKALVFYKGKPPKGIKTNWIMHEYRLIQNHLNHKPQHLPPDLPNKKGSLRLDDWVLCRIYMKNNCQRSVEIRENSSSTGHHHAMFSSKNVSLLDVNEDNNNNNNYFFDHGMINDQGIVQNNQFAMSSAGGGGGSTSTITTATLPVKPQPPVLPQYWNNNSGKRFHDYLNNNNNNNNNIITDDHDDENHNNNSYVSLLNQIPQGAVFHNNMHVIGAGDAVLRPQFQLPNINWNS